jgi:hypothetical protein
MRVLVDLINNQVQSARYVQPRRLLPPRLRLRHRPWLRLEQRPFDCLFASYLPDINWLVRQPRTDHR